MSADDRPGLELRQIIARTRHLLLDFDGPVCDVYAGTSATAVAGELRASLKDLPLPAHALNSDDPLEVLKAAAMLGPEPGARAQEGFVRLEVQAISTASPTRGAAELMAAARESGWSVAIVSNNSGPAISAYLAAHDLTRYVHAVFGRDDPDPAKMKPDPYRVHEAIASVDATPSQCLLIGDSPSDVTAAQAAGVIAIGFANKPGKERLLLKAGAKHTVTDMSQIAQALRESQGISTKGQPWATTRRARAVMQGNRSRDTKPELAVRSALHALGMRYRVATRPIPTLNRTADIVFRRARVAVFVDGCFWHGCPEHYVRSASNIKYWDDKIRKNRDRDADTDTRLMASGWLTVRIWEHQDPIAAANDIAELVRQRLAALDSGRADPPMS